MAGQQTVIGDNAFLGLAIKTFSAQYGEAKSS